MYLCYDRQNQLPLTSTPNSISPQKPLTNGPSGYQDGLKLLLLAIQAECDPDEKSIDLPFPSSWKDEKPNSGITLPAISWGEDRTLTSDDDKDCSPPSSPGRDSKMCTQCGATETPKWRRGMSEDGLAGVRLCNACGIRSKRLLRRKSPKHSSHSRDRKRQKELKKAYLKEKKSRHYSAYRLPPSSFISLPPMIRSQGY